MAEIYIYRAITASLIDCAFSERDYEGAVTKGGRWNSIGTPMVYASDHISTAGWEVAQRINLDPSLDPGRPLRERILDILAETHYYFRVAINPSQVVSVEDFCTVPLAADWHKKLLGMNFRPEIQAIGDRWVKGKTSLALRVPCALTRRHAFNYLLNPWHPDYASLVRRREGFWRYDGEEPDTPKT